MKLVVVISLAFTDASIFPAITKVLRKGGKENSLDLSTDSELGSEPRSSISDTEHSHDSDNSLGDGFESRSTSHASRPTSSLSIALSDIAGRVSVSLSALSEAISECRRRQDNVRDLLESMGYAIDPAFERVVDILPGTLLESKPFKKVMEDMTCAEDSNVSELCIYPLNKIVPPVFVAEQQPKTRETTWLMIAERATKRTKEKALINLRSFAGLIMRGCGEIPGMSVVPPRRSIEQQICYPMAKPSQGSENCEECMRAWAHCTESRWHVGGIVSQCEEWSRLCLSSASERCLMFGEHVRFLEYSDFHQIVADSARAGHRSADDKLSEDKKQNLLEQSRKDCQIALLALIYGDDVDNNHEFISGYTQGMTDVCQYFRSFMGYSLTETIVIMEYLYKHVNTLFKLPYYRQTIYSQALYAYLRLALEPNLRTILDDAQMKTQTAQDPDNNTTPLRFFELGNALLMFHFSMGTRDITDMLIKPHLMIPVWDFIFRNGRKGFLALFLAGIKLNERLLVEGGVDFDERGIRSLDDLIKIKTDVETTIGLIVINPLGPRMRAIPNNGEDFDDQVANIFKEYLEHANKYLGSDNFKTLTASVDGIIDSIMEETNYPIQINKKASDSQSPTFFERMFAPIKP